MSDILVTNFVKAYLLNGGFMEYAATKFSTTKEVVKKVVDDWKVDNNLRAAVAAKGGSAVSFSAVKRGEYYLVSDKNTFNYKNSFPKAGCKWNKDEKAWEFKCSEAANVLQALETDDIVIVLPSTSSTSTSKSSKVVAEPATPTNDYDGEDGPDGPPSPPSPPPAPKPVKPANQSKVQVDPTTPMTSKAAAPKVVKTEPAVAPKAEATVKPTPAAAMAPTAKAAPAPAPTTAPKPVAKAAPETKAVKAKPEAAPAPKLTLKYTTRAVASSDNPKSEKVLDALMKKINNPECLKDGREYIFPGKLASKIKEVIENNKTTFETAEETAIEPTTNMYFENKDGVFMAIGYLDDENELHDLEDSHIEICKNNKWEYLVNIETATDAVSEHDEVDEVDLEDDDGVADAADGADGSEGSDDGNASD